MLRDEQSRSRRSGMVAGKAPAAPMQMVQNNHATVPVRFAADAPQV